MSKRDDGGAAFPATPYSHGMSLRDYFAAAALPAVITMTGDEGATDTDADLAYRIADAMLVARKLNPP